MSAKKKLLGMFASVTPYDKSKQHRDITDAITFHLTKKRLAVRISVFFNIVIYITKKNHKVSFFQHRAALLGA